MEISLNRISSILNTAGENFRDLRCRKQNGDDEEGKEGSRRGKGRGRKERKKVKERREPQDNIKLPNVFSKMVRNIDQQI